MSFRPSIVVTNGFSSMFTERPALDWQLYPLDHLSNYLPVWDELNRRGPASPLLSAAFVAPAVDCFGRPGDRIAICRAGTRPVAMGILRPAGIGRWSTLQPVAVPLGLWVAANDAGVQELLSALLSNLPGFPVMLSVTNQDCRLACRPRSEGSIDTADYMRTAAIEIGNPFADYWETRKQHFRHDLKRRRRRLARECKEASLQIATRPDAVRSAFEEYCDLEHRGWKGQNGSSIEQDGTAKRFYGNMLENFAKQGNARIFQYLYNDRLVASDLCIRDANTLVVLKIAYDETESATSPALLMREEQVRHVAEHENIGKIEFYGPLMDWHERWATEITQMYHINAYRFQLIRVAHQRQTDLRNHRRAKLNANAVAAGA